MTTAAAVAAAAANRGMVGGSAGPGDLTDPNIIINVFQKLQQECQSLAARLSEFDLELNEHELVIQQLKPLDPSRKAYRLVGGVLVERTVGEILPLLVAFSEKLKEVIKQCAEALEQKERQTREWKEKYNIRAQTTKEIQAQQQKMAAAGRAAAENESSAGVLA